jgi:hypothetical protein
MANWLISSAVVVVVLLAVLWPVRRSGVNLLRRWGIAQPRPDQVAHAVGYLKRRRLLYVLLYVVLAPVVALLDGKDDDTGAGTAGPVTFFVPLLLAMLLAELFAVVRPVRGPRVASLDPRGWRDLIPRWAVAVGAVLMLLVVVLSTLGLAAQPWANRYAAALPPNSERFEVSDEYRAEMTSTTSWAALAGAAVCLVLVILLVHLAVRRPAVPDEALDAALRTRTARVAVAIGFGWLGAAVMVAGHRIRFLDQLDTVTCTPPLPQETGWDCSSMVPEVVAPPAPGWLDGMYGWMEIGVSVVQLASIACWLMLAMPTRRKASVSAAG